MNKEYDYINTFAFVNSNFVKLTFAQEPSDKVKMNYKDYGYIYEQYLKTNFSELLDGFAEVKNKHIGKACNAMKADILDLQTAKGNALDEWGRMLGFSRFIPMITSEQLSELEYQMTPADWATFFGAKLNTFAFVNSNFKKLTFAQGAGNPDSVGNYAILDDDQYRLILQFIYQTQNADITTETLTIFFNGFFDMDVSVIDRQNMIQEIYYFIENLPVWLQLVFAQFDIIPRPAGVKSELKRGTYKYFGFRTDDDVFNEEYISNFAVSIFKE